MQKHKPEHLALAVRVYDALMGKINTELLSATVDKVGAQRGGESRDAWQKRLRGYKKDFATYDKEYKKFMEEVHHETHTFSTQKRKAAEDQSRAAEAAAEEELLKRINAA